MTPSHPPRLSFVYPFIFYPFQAFHAQDQSLLDAPEFASSRSDHLVIISQVQLHAQSFVMTAVSRCLLTRVCSQFQYILLPYLQHFPITTLIRSSFFANRHLFHAYRVLFHEDSPAHHSKTPHAVVRLIHCCVCSVRGEPAYHS